MTRLRSSLLVLTTAASLFTMGDAHAQLSGLASLASSLGGMLAGGGLPGMGAAEAGYDVDGFMRQSADLSELAGRAVTAINAAFATEEQLAAKRAALASLNRVADPKERQARYAALYAAESAETRRLLDSGEMEQHMARLDGEKRRLVGQALLNFAIASLQAVELGKHGQALVQQAGMSPVELVRILPVKDAIPLLGKVAIDASGFIAGVARLARAADIGVPDAHGGVKPLKLELPGSSGQARGGA